MSFHGLNFIVLDSIIGYSNVDKELEINGSIQNDLMLANLKENSDENDDACTSALDIISFRQGRMREAL